MLATLRRLWRHHWMDESDTRRLVPPDALERLRRRVAESEARHTGQLRICVEAGLPSSYLWRHLRRHLPMRRIVRERALMMFAKLGVWDTEHNNGVLIYLLLADRDVEILADRGFNGKVAPQEWEAICREMEACFARGEFEQGALAGITRADALLRRHFPVAGANPNELPDAPAVI